MTQSQFNDKWKELHSFFDVSSELLFYYALYVKLQSMMKNAFDEMLFDMLLYVEDMAQVALCVDYADMYRCVDDLPTMWMSELAVSKKVQKEVKELLRERIEQAPKGALKEWIRSSVMAGDFYSLKGVAMWFYYNHPALKRLQCMADARYNVYRDLFDGNYVELQKWVHSDYALNWRDKEGHTILEHIAFGYELHREVELADRLKSVVPISIDCYYADKVDGTKVTLRTKDGHVFDDVEFFTPIEQDWQNLCCICMVTGYNEHWYINGPGVWHDKESMAKWPGTQMFLDAVDEDEKDIALNQYFKDANGEQCNLYADLYSDGDFADDIDDIDCWRMPVGFNDNGDGDDEDDFFDMFEGLQNSGVLDKFKELLSTREGAEQVLNGLNIPLDLADLDHNPRYMTRQQRRKMEGVKIPNFKYKPKGKQPVDWFQKKVMEVRDWTIVDSSDLLYALRVYEGWMKQAHEYHEAMNWDYAHFISSIVMSESVNFFEDNRHKKDYKKYHNRIKKIVRDSHELTMRTALHDPANWREVLLEHFEWMKKDHAEDPYSIFDTNAPFSIEESIRMVKEMMKSE